HPLSHGLDAAADRPAAVKTGEAFVVHRSCLLAVMLLLGYEARADDPPVFPGESAALGRRFQELVKKEEAARKEGSDTRWTETLDEMQALMDSAGDDLVPLGDGRVMQ